PAGGSTPPRAPPRHGRAVRASETGSGPISAPRVDALGDERTDVPPFRRPPFAERVLEASGHRSAPAKEYDPPLVERAIRIGERLASVNAKRASIEVPFESQRFA